MQKNWAWDDRYKTGKEALPWDTGMPAPELVKYFSSLSSLPKRALEIGCGTGTDAVWMAQQGVLVKAIDISPTAIESAKDKSKAAGVKVDFSAADITQKIPVSEGSVDFVFDRGVYHVMAPEQRATFVDRVAASLEKDGHWLCIAGSADQNRDPESLGPPQLKASELIDNIEPKFEVIALQRASFILPDGNPHLAWQALFKKRTV